MKVYIAGKIGEEHPSPETLAKFKAAEEMLQKKGYEVFNPTTSGFGVMADEAVLQAKDKGLETTWYAEILKLDLDALSFCDCIYLLKDYKISGGAMTEYTFAKALRKKILFQEMFHALDFLGDIFDEKVGKGIIEVDPFKLYAAVRQNWSLKHVDEAWLQL